MERAYAASMQSTSLRIDGATHQELGWIAGELGATMGETVALIVHHYRQYQIGKELEAPLTPDEMMWLSADLA